ncbi:MAG: DmsC/YnfH family molybdoenzyme membrane anchor subunit [Verrucomicrobiota bacterium]
MIGAHDHRTLIDELLAEQQRLTAVDRFSQRHERNAIPAQAKYYRDLIPLTKPQAGQQYAFQVDLDKCSGCKACVSACHSLNGLDEGESWRDTGLLFSDDWRQPFQQTITTACHHCAEPGCADGCPVLAYEKDPVTGIVRHLDDQCIGCQYCVMKCPYDVPKYSSRRGIVRKCDMCANRLAVGEAPACVQACPQEAIRITTVDREAILRDAASSDLLPAAPDSSYTKPATRYLSAKRLPKNLLPGDHARVRPEPAHLPLVFMLVLTQLAVGTSVVSLAVESAKWLALVTAVTGAVALNIAALHLGKPLKAWRAFLGWRTSWFSREVIAFGAFVPMATLSALACWREELQPFLLMLKWATALTGLAGVACSAMIYTDTHREFWRASQSLGKFFGTTALLGMAASLVIFKWTQSGFSEAGRVIVLMLAAVSIFKLSFEHRIRRHLVDEQTPGLTPLNKTALLLEGQLGIVARGRIGAGVVGGIFLPLLSLHMLDSSVVVAAFTCCLLGEFLERYLFFTAVAPLRMPGGMAA